MKIFDWVIKDNISPGGNFYYAFKQPESLNPSAFGCEIAFYNQLGQLLYHNKVALAHELNDPAEVEKSRAIGEGMLLSDNSPMQKASLRFAAWSKQGNMVHILEYFKYEGRYEHVFINLDMQYQIRALYAIKKVQEYISIDASTLTLLGIFRPQFDEGEVLHILKDLGLLIKEPLIKDLVNDNFITNIFPNTRWYR